MTVFMMVSALVLFTVAWDSTEDSRKKQKQGKK